MDFFSRRFLRSASIAVAVVVAYAGGVLTGVCGSLSNGEAERLGAQSASSAPGVLDEAASRIAANASRPVDPEVLQRAAIDGMLRTLGDRWSSYLGPSEFASFEDALEGRYSGVGVWLRRGAAGVEVGSVQAGSPAASAGVASGDVLIAVDGRSLTGGSVEEAAERLRGAGGSAVSLALRSSRGNQSVRDVRLTRAHFSTASVAVERLRGSVLRLAVTGFPRGVGREVRAALEAHRLTSRGGVVLDLRDNSGGYLDEAVEVASAFLDGGPVVSYERRGEAPRVLEALGRGDTTTPVVVLVDRATASAAEVVTAALQDRGRAVVVGSRTYGKGSVQEPARLADGSALELTVGEYRTPAGRRLEGVGIEPDVLVGPRQTSELAERRALEVLSGLLAALGPGGRG